jgi:hypothetical protein
MELIIGRATLTLGNAAASAAGSGQSRHSGNSVAPCTTSTSQHSSSASRPGKVPAFTSM